jgi:hypothetical protein
MKLIQSTSASGTANTVTSSAVDTTGANFIVLGLAYQVSSNPTLTDSQSNTWTALTESAFAGNVAVCLYYCVNPKTNASHTFSMNGTTIFPSIAMLAFSEVNTVPVDVENGANNGTAQSTLATGSITPTFDDELLVTVLGFNNSGTPVSIDNSFTMVTSQNFLSGNHYGVGIAYKIQQGATAVNPTWTRTGTGRNATRIASFKANRIGLLSVI